MSTNKPKPLPKGGAAETRLIVKVRHILRAGLIWSEDVDNFPDNVLDR